MSGDETVAVIPVPVVTNIVLPEATACVFEPSDNMKPAAAIAIELISFTASITEVADKVDDKFEISPKSFAAKALNSILNLSKLSVSDTCLTAIICFLYRIMFLIYL